MPESVKSIGYIAFSDNVSLNGVLYLPNIEQVDGWFIASDGFSKVVFGKSLNFVSNAAFMSNAYNTGLVEIEVDSECEKYFSYGGCLYERVEGGVKLIACPHSIRSDELVLHESTVEIGNRAFYSCIGIKKVVVPDGLTLLKGASFYSCSAIEEITFGDGIVEIESNAFQQCSGLKKITFGKNLQTVATDAIYYCNSLGIIVISEENPYLSASNGMIIRKEDGALVKALAPNMAELVIPDGVTLLLNGSINNLNTVERISLPSTAYLEETVSLFTLCPKLESITVAEGNTKLASVDGVLYNKELTVLYKYTQNKNTVEYSIPNTVTEIHQNAFVNNTRINKLIIPTSVTKIGSLALSSCSSLSTVEYKGKTSEWANVDRIHDGGSYDYYKSSSFSVITCSDGNGEL